MCIIALLGNNVFGQVTDDYRSPNIEEKEQAADEKEENKKGKDADFLANRYFTGGDMGLQFGSVTVINVAPRIGYRVTKRLNAGIGVTYLYYRERTYGQIYQDNIYGASIFGQYIILPTVLAHMEYEGLNRSYGNSRVWGQGFLIGAGYRQQMGGHSFFNMMLLYNVLEDRYYPYPNPIIRAGFNIGI